MRRPVLLLVASLVVFAAATAGMLTGVEPFATWYYPLAWYPTLVAADALIRLRTGRYHLLAHPASAVALLLWSVPFWLSFEAANFRLANWYYVFLPADAVSRWTGIVLSFATVLPAIFVAPAVLGALGVAEPLEGPRVFVPAGLTWSLQGVGVVMAALALIRPGIFFPLIWGAVTLLADPWVYRREARAPGESVHRSLLGHLARGRYGLPARLLLGGLAIGFLWELYNVAARGKWIYTVPGLEALKLFEMPLLGFLGFPVLALDGYAVWQALRVAGLAPGEDLLVPEPGASDPPGATEEARSGKGKEGPPTVERRRRERGSETRNLRPKAWAPSVVGALAAVGSVGVLLGMERWTITSVAPELEDVAGTYAPRLRSDGMDAWDVARSDADALSDVTGAAPERAAAWIRTARLATLRGIGAANTRRLRGAGIASVDELAEAHPDSLTAELLRAGLPGSARAWRARVRVWVRAAREARSR